MTEIKNDDVCKKIFKIAQRVRRLMVSEHPDNENLCGCCVEASEEIQEMLNKENIESELIEGWCLYDDDSSCTDRCYDEHTWVEACGYYIDVTADQFNSCMYKPFPEIIVTKNRPSCMLYEEPLFQWLDEDYEDDDYEDYEDDEDEDDYEWDE